MFQPDLAKPILLEIRKILDQENDPARTLQQIWLELVYMQNLVLSKVVEGVIGNKVYSGPFKGMQLTPAVMVNAFGPVLIGSYEHELHGIVDHIIGTPYKHILNIGCGYGYYSVGMALRMPSIQINGFDIDEEEQKRCKEMAILNNVQDRILVSGRFDGNDFASYTDQKTLAIVDIEGAELDLLDPIKYPALQEIDILVELHEVYLPGISKAICKRFEATHDIQMVYNRGTLFDFHQLVGKETYVDSLDSLIIGWENRAGATPWAFMQKKPIKI